MKNKKGLLKPRQVHRVAGVVIEAVRPVNRVVGVVIGAVVIGWVVIGAVNRVAGVVIGAVVIGAVVIGAVVIEAVVIWAVHRVVPVGVVIVVWLHQSPVAPEGWVDYSTKKMAPTPVDLVVPTGGSNETTPTLRETVRQI